MKKYLMALPLIGLLAACETQDQALLATTATGAVIGAAVSSDDDRLTGALIGSAAGLAAGALLLGKNARGECIYERPDGSRYAASC